MNDQNTFQPGSIAWTDLTVPDAEAIRDFYSQVVGWRPEGVDMGGYNDFNMLLPAGDRPAAGRQAALQPPGPGWKWVLRHPGPIWGNRGLVPTMKIYHGV